MKKIRTTVIQEVNREYIKEKDILSFIEFLFDRINGNKYMEFNILFSDDKRIMQLNKQFKNKNEPTDILSFYGYDGDVLGDIIISVETMEKDAQEDRRDIVDYMLFLIAHGFLHLNGYTHETMEKYDEMIALQNTLVEEWKNEKRN